MEAEENGDTVPSYDGFTQPVGLSPRPNKRPRARSHSRSHIEEEKRESSHLIVRHLTELHKTFFAEVKEQMIRMVRMEERMIRMEERMINTAGQYPNEQVQQLKNELVEEISADVLAEVTPEVLGQVEAAYEQYVDDRVDGIKLELEDFVQDEMRSVQDTVLDEFAGGPWRFQRAAS